MDKIVQQVIDKFCQRSEVVHNGSHATGNEYGWDKSELVSKYWGQYFDNINGYRNGTKSIKL